MIYLFHGSDAAATRAKAFAWVAAARAKAPDAAYVRLSAEQLSEASLRDALASQGLFYTRSLVLLDDPFSEEDSGEVLLSLLSELAASANPIGILAPKLLATRVKKLEAHAAKVFTVSTAEKKPVRGFNSGLVNALAAKESTTLWKELQKAARLGDAPEMLHGLLHWKARDLMQKGGTMIWSKEDARNLSRDLIELLSDSRSGDLPLALALERFSLSIGSSAGKG